MLVFNVCGGDRVDELTAAGGGGVSSRSIALLGEDGKRAGRWDWVGPCSGVFVLPDIIDAGENEVSEYIYGSNTGGQNWSDSYAALDLLDSDRSGWLEGDELKKVAVWVDRSSDARVDPWEIKPASDTISKINVAPQLSSEGDLGVRDSGVVFQTGGGSSTWCWESKPRP